MTSFWTGNIHGKTVGFENEPGLGEFFKLIPRSEFTFIFSITAYNYQDFLIDRFGSLGK